MGFSRGALERLLPGGMWDDAQSDDDDSGSGGRSPSARGPGGGLWNSRRGGRELRSIGLLVGGDGTIWATAVQGDGRIVAVGSEPSGTFVDGTETSAWFIRRYLADGDVDTDFGSSGVVNLFGESTRNERAIDVALDAAGGIVVGGRGSLAVTSGKGKRQTTLQVPYAVVVRLEPDGGLDLDFGDDGYAFLSDISLLDAIAIQADGRIVISSEAQISNSGGGSKKKGGGGGNLTTALYLACLTSTGSLDSTFGSGGVVIRNLSSESFLTDEFAGHHELALQSNGDIILGAATRIGGGRQYWKLLRFDEDGLFDSTFGIVEESGLQLDGLTTDGSDRIVCVGLDQSTLDLVVIRYTASGARDTSFGSGGRDHGRREQRGLRERGHPDGRIPCGGCRLSDRCLGSLLDDRARVRRGWRPGHQLRYRRLLRHDHQHGRDRGHASLRDPAR